MKTMSIGLVAGVVAHVAFAAMVGTGGDRPRETRVLQGFPRY